MDGPMPSVPLGTFLVERYWPGIDLEHLRVALTRLEAEVTALTAQGRLIEHVGSILMPADEVVFSLIAAEDAALVRQLDERAELPADRIAVAIPLIAGLADATPGASTDQDPGGTAS